MFHLLRRLIFNRVLFRVVRRYKRFSFPFMIIWALRAMAKKGPVLVEFEADLKKVRKKSPPLILFIEIFSNSL